MEQLGDDTGITDVTFSQAYLATRNITILNPARHTTLLVELESRVAKEMTSTQRHFRKRTTGAKVEDHMTQINGISNPLAVYVARNHGERKKGGRFGVENGKGHFVKGGRCGVGNGGVHFG
jgi:hypothetical protein